ncbi:hypothetical protein EW146_g9387 [Bondarzewia mesenterica]|uniref:Uncharacterized protein n=1 Tax=Bondarzewia mesenterica TaxID=1095465 RepID=A0A4S4L6R1_9AGAM|nr:hypothetical protein EW146_g9387 [Bondarzewia mesenterica]
MAPVAASAPDEKRKKPPTFQHLPEQRAKKLKKLWVEKQKIKSKWKAEKRKEGIVTRRDAAGLAKEEIAEVHEGGSEEDEKQEPRQPVKRKLGEDDATDGERDSSTDSNPASSAREKRRKDSQKDTDEELEKPSLRELQKQAYSRSSLH